MVVTGRAALLALLLTVPVALVARSLVVVLLLDLALLLLLAIDATLAGSPRRLSFARSGDRTTRLGEDAVVTLTVRNDGGRSVRGVLRDAWAPTAGVAVTRHALALAPERVVRVAAVLRPTRRGERRPDLVTVRSLGPMRLAGRQASHAVPWGVQVLPGFPSRKHLPSRLARLRELDGRTALMVRGQGTEFDSLREYVIGDDVRSIDWRATARASDVMVRTWRPERDRRVLLVLDTSRTSAARVGDGTRLDAVDGRRVPPRRAGEQGGRPRRPARVRPCGARGRPRCDRQRAAAAHVARALRRRAAARRDRRPRTRVGGQRPGASARVRRDPQRARAVGAARGAAAVPPGPRDAPHGAARVGRATPASRSSPPRAATSRRSTTPPRPRRPSAPATG